MTTQLDCSIGLKEETVYGTGVTVDQWLEFTDEGLDANLTFAQGEGMRVGARLERADRRMLTKKEPGGPVGLEASSSGLGRILNAVFGTVSNTLVTGAVYQQVHTPALTDLLKSYTIQKGIPPVGGGATIAHTFLGAMCNSIEFSAAAGEILKVATEWLAKDITTATAYTSPSYPSSPQLFTFAQGVIYVGNTVIAPTTTALASATGSQAANIVDFSCKFENGFDTEGFTLGGNGLRARKNVVGQGKLTGKLTAEFDSVTLRDAYLNNTSLSLLLTFTAPVAIGASLYPVIQIYIPAIKLEGELPKSAGGGVIKQSIDFTGLDSLAASTSPIYVAYRTLDTAP